MPREVRRFFYNEAAHAMTKALELGQRRMQIRQVLCCVGTISSIKFPADTTSAEPTRRLVLLIAAGPIGASERFSSRLLYSPVNTRRVQRVGKHQPHCCTHILAALRRASEQMQASLQVSDTGA